MIIIDGDDMVTTYGGGLDDDVVAENYDGMANTYVVECSRQWR